MLRAGVERPTDLEVEWWRDPSGYTLLEAVPPAPYPPNLIGSLGMLSNEGRPARIVRNGDQKISYRPLLEYGGRHLTKDIHPRVKPEWLATFYKPFWTTYSEWAQ